MLNETTYVGVWKGVFLSLLVMAEVQWGMDVS